MSTGGHGGARKGAGAPKGPRKSPRKVSRAVRLPAEAVALWDALAELLDASQADTLIEALEALRDRLTAEGRLRDE